MYSTLQPSVAALSYRISDHNITKTKFLNWANYLCLWRTQQCLESIPPRCNRSGMGSTSTIPNIIQFRNCLPSGSTKTQIVIYQNCLSQPLSQPIFTRFRKHMQPNVLVWLRKIWLGSCLCHIQNVTLIFMHMYGRMDEAIVSCNTCSLGYRFWQLTFPKSVQLL